MSQEEETFAKLYGGFCFNFIFDRLRSVMNFSHLQKQYRILQKRVDDISLREKEAITRYERIPWLTLLETIGLQTAVAFSMRKYTIFYFRPNLPYLIASLPALAFFHSTRLADLRNLVGEIIFLPESNEPSPIGKILQYEYQTVAPADYERLKLRFRHR